MLHQAPELLLLLLLRVVVLVQALLLRVVPMSSYRHSHCSSMDDHCQGQNIRPNQEEEELPSPQKAVLPPTPPHQVAAAQVVAVHNHNRAAAPHNTAAAAPGRPEDCNYCIPLRLLGLHSGLTAQHTEQV